MTKLYSSRRDPGKTIIVAYFVYSNGTALTSNEVEKMLSDPEHYPVLGQLGLANIVSTSNFRIERLFSERVSSLSHILSFNYMINLIKAVLHAPCSFFCSFHHFISHCSCCIIFHCTGKDFILYGTLSP